MKNRGGRFAVTIIYSVLSGTSAIAQDAMSFLNEANIQIRTVCSMIYQIVIAVLNIIAIVSPDNRPFGILKKAVQYRLCAPSGARTLDPNIKSVVLYQLS